MNRESLERLEDEIREELKKVADAEKSLRRPITDGVVDIDCYIASNPRILWILKEPWEELDEAGRGGDWSVTQGLLSKPLETNRGTYAPMAYVTYAIFHGFPAWDKIHYVTQDPEVANCLRCIAYINISKLPGPKQSNSTSIALAYTKNRNLLLKQINTINPDIIIGGSTLYLFFDDLGLTREMFTKHGSASFCANEGRLYIDAYHPNQRTVTPADYVNDIVSIVRDELTAKVREMDD
jgi:hypothetical protein